jgi:hypothetical protein
MRLITLTNKNFTPSRCRASTDKNIEAKRGDFVAIIRHIGDENFFFSATA